MSNQDPFTMTEDEWLDLLNRTIAKDPEEDRLRIMSATLYLFFRDRNAPPPRPFWKRFFR